MLARPGVYLPEALAAAKEELRKRNLTPESLAGIATAAAQSRVLGEQTETQERHKRHLAILVLHFLLPLGIALFFLIKELIAMLMRP